MKFGSVCSGIEAASCAWESLGWKAAFFSEIEKFPSQVLAHHYPDVPNLGDMTKFKEWPDANINVLVGGTPCQSFSVAGLRRGLDDPRGNLMLTFLAIADRYRPKWLVWENVPGVLSSNGGKDFGTFLGGLGELGYGFAYRVLDAQYFGVPQRRRRVFVVACLGNWQSAAAVLFERHCFEGHPAPSRKKGEDIAGTFTARANSGGWSSDVDLAASNYMQPVAKCLTASKGQRNDVTTDNFVGFWNGNEIAESLTCTSNNQRMPDKGKMQMVVQPTYSLQGAGVTSQNAQGSGWNEEVSFTLNRMDVHGVAQPIPINSMNAMRSPDADPSTGCGLGEEGEAMFTLTKGNHHAVAQPIAYSFDSTASNSMKSSNPISGCNEVNVTKTLDTSRGLDPTCNQGGIAIAQPTVVHGTQDPCTSDIAFAQGRNNGGENVLVQAVGTDLYNGNMTGDVAATMGTPGSSVNASGPTVMQSMAVRRLTPVECERLQGFPDGYTDIKLRGKETPDGPRYKALGNSMAVPVMRWIGERIQLLEDCL